MKKFSRNVSTEFRGEVFRILLNKCCEFRIKLEKKKKIEIKDN